MTALFILIATLAMTIFALMKRSFPLSFIAMLGWLLILVYTRSNPLAGMTTGSYSDTILLFICLLMIPLLLFNWYVKTRSEKVQNGVKKVAFYNEAGDYVGRHEIEEVKKSSQYETIEQYRQRLREGIDAAKANRSRYRK